MILKQLTSPTSALPSRPERPFKHVWPVTTQDGSVGYDRPLENYFDPSMAQRILPAVPSGRLYDTVARAHDFRYQVTPNMLWSTPRPLKLTERRRSLAKVSGDSPDYMGISPDLPGWHPRRSPHEDRRGTVSVTPKEVNSLVPYIPPIDTSFPPPKEWLDAMAKHILADAHADLNDSHYNDPTSSDPSAESDDTFFDYDTDSTLDAATVPRTSTPQPPQSESDHDADFNSNTDTDTETDTDIDMESDDACDRNATPTSYSGPGAQWLIRRKRPSIVFNNNKNVTLRSGGGDRYRRRGGKIGFPGGISKTPKTYANDTPARQPHKSTTPDERYSCTERSSSLAPPRTSPPPGSDAATSSCPPVSSITATALQMNHVRIASPAIASPPLVPQPNLASSVPPRSPKLFPCLLDTCAQICASAGDLQRHQQSLRHRVPSYVCLACGKSYTRSDALKRHLNSKASCKKEHATKLIDDNVQGDQVAAEANDEAVQVVVTSSE